MRQSRPSKKRKVPNASSSDRIKYCPGDREIKDSFRESKPRKLSRLEEEEREWELDEDED